MRELYINVCTTKHVHRLIIKVAISWYFSLYFNHLGLLLRWWSLLLWKKYVHMLILIVSAHHWGKGFDQAHCNSVEEAKNSERYWVEVELIRKLQKLNWKMCLKKVRNMMMYCTVCICVWMNDVILWDLLQCTTVYGIQYVWK